MRISLILCFFLFIQSQHGCKTHVPCEGTISSTLLDPSGAPCTKQCECNNQYFEGFCVDGICKAIGREKCDIPKRKDSCLPAFPTTTPCKSYTRVCQDEGMTSLRFGDCKCDIQPRVEKPRVEKPVPKEPVPKEPVPKEPAPKEPAPKEPTIEATQEPPPPESIAEGPPGDLCIKNVEICNSKDDDCDGNIDNHIHGTGQRCDTLSKGLCAEGTTRCQKGKMTCVPNQSPKTEICNAKDDDCNGKIDEHCPIGQECDTVSGKCTTCPQPATKKCRLPCTSCGLKCLCGYKCKISHLPPENSCIKP